MPRAKKKKMKKTKRGAGRRLALAKSVREGQFNAGRYSSVLSRGSAGVIALALNPLDNSWMDARCSVFGTVWGQFRYTRLNFRMYLPTASATFVAGYSPAPFSVSTPASFEEVANLPVSVIQQTGFVKPASLRLGPDVLLGEDMLKWFRVHDSTDPARTDQGTIYIYVPGSLAFVYTVEWEIEWSAPRDVSSQLMISQVIADGVERKRSVAQYPAAGLYSAPADGTGNTPQGDEDGVVVPCSVGATNPRLRGPAVATGGGSGRAAPSGLRPV